MTRSAVPVARPVAWSTLQGTTWSAGRNLRSGARTVLMSSGSSTSVVPGWREGRLRLEQAVQGPNNDVAVNALGRLRGLVYRAGVVTVRSRR